MPLPSKDTDPVGHYAYKLGEAEQEIKQMRVALLKIDQAALATAAKKLRKLRLEDVGGRKERPAETVGSAMDKVFNGLGSTEGQEYVLRHGLKYYFEALSNYDSAPTDPHHGGKIWKP